jgi:hypothetical protein
MASKEVGDPVAGYFFTPPEGWLAEEQQGRFVLALPSSDSVAMVIPHAATGRDELQPLFDQGWIESGVELKPDGEAVVQEDGATQPLAGEVQGQQAHGTLIVRFSPSGGGVIVLGISPPGASEPEVAGAIQDIGGSLRFTAPDTAEMVRSWDALVRGKKLTYLHSYGSSGPAVEGMMTGGGMTEQHEILLHPDGTFDEAGEFSLSIDVGGAGAGGGERVDPSGGTWEILPAAGQALLELHREEGEDTSYVLTQSDGEVYLNGRRYFVTEP